MDYKKKVLPVVISIIALLMMFLWLTGNLGFKKKVKPGMEALGKTSLKGLETYKVRYLKKEIEAEVPGSVEAREESEISSRIMAGITKINVKEGDRFKQGDLLVVLDSRDAVAALEGANEMLAESQAAFTLAGLEAKRFENLFHRKSATEEENDRARTQFTMAKAKREQAQKSVRDREVYLSYYKITASISGIVAKKLANSGDMAVPGKPILNIYSPEKLRVKASIPETYFKIVKIGKQLKVKVDTIGNILECMVEEVSPLSDPSTRSFEIKVTLPGKENLYPGMFAKIYIPLGEQEIILIPEQALLKIGQLEAVDVIEDGRVVRRTIRVGKIFPEGLEVVSGLKEGDEVILRKTL